MKLFISVDMEGLSGIVSWQWWKDNKVDAKRILLANLLPVIETVLNYDKDAEILIVDSHSTGENITVLDIPEQYKNVYLINGFPRKDYMMSGISEEFDGVFFIGYHSMAGGAGAMDHTYSSRSVYSIKINGKEVGETTINAAFAGEFGIPVSLVVGQKEMREEIDMYIPWAVHSIVQETIGKFAIKSYSITKVEEILKRDTKKALENIVTGKVKIFKFSPPINVEITWLSTSIADVVSQMPIMRRVTPRTTVYTVNNWIEGFRWLLSAVYISYLGQR